MDKMSDLYEKTVQLKKIHGILSIVFLQRKLQIGYQTAKELKEMVDGI